jgi:LacI family transcriptional regulator
MNREREITIYDLARELNLSTATISRALKNDPVVNKKTKKRIAELAEERGYRSNQFARNLRNQTTQTIGVIVPRLNSYFMSTVIAGIENVVNLKGYNLIISQSSESVQKEKLSVATMFRNRVDGLLVSLAYDTDNTVHFEPFFNKNIPILFFDRVAQFRNCSRILIDNRKAGYGATAHLIAQGCKNIVHITAASKRNVYIDRLQGYRQALADHKIKFSEGNLITNNLSLEAGTTAAATLMKMSSPPDGVFVANDNCAVGCMIALKKAGIQIPGDIAFVGFNNDPVSKVIEPNLTTINYPGYEMGQVAAQQLINHLHGSVISKTDNSILLHSELIIRASSKRKKITSAS